MNGSGEYIKLVKSNDDNWETRRILFEHVEIHDKLSHEENNIMKNLQQVMI